MKPLQDGIWLPFPMPKRLATDLVCSDQNGEPGWDQLGVKDLEVCHTCRVVE